MITGDFETRSIVDLKKFGAMRYATDPHTQVLCLAWAFDDDDEVHLWHRDHPWIDKSERPDELLERIAAGEIFEAHNAKFEYVIWNYVLRREFPEFDVPLMMEQMRCSAAKASCLSLRRRLGDALKDIGAPVEFQKDPEGERLINKLSKPMPRRKNDLGGPPKFCEEEAEHRRNWEYCKQDVRAERYLSHWCGGCMSERELQFWFMDFRMNMRGIKLDKEAAREAIKLCDNEVKRLDAEMQTITNGAVSSGSKRIPFRKWANEQIDTINALGFGDPMPVLEDTRADTLSFALYGVPTKAAEEAKVARMPAMKEIWDRRGTIGEKLKRAMEISIEVNKSSVAKFRTMIGGVCSDGRLHDIMLYNGAERTGRWAGQGVQPHNFVRGYSRDMPLIWEWLLADADPAMVTLVTGEQMLTTLAKACRGALIASEGCELYAADFAAIEARKLAWMAGCTSQLNLFANGGDPYIDMACGIYKINCDATDKDQIQRFRKERATERQLGKTAVLGLGYAMGWEKFQWTVFMGEGVWLDDEFCQTVVNVYRRNKCPEMPALWKAMNDAAIKATLAHDGSEFRAGSAAGGVTYFTCGRFLHCRLPSGRLLAYLDPEVHNKIRWIFPAKNERGTLSPVTFPSKVGVPTNRAKHHAEKLAEKARKTLTGDPPETYVQPHLSFMGRNILSKQWQRIGTHGGTLTENADQASSRDLLAEAMWRVDQDDRFALLLSIHDEVIAEAPIGACDVKEFERIMSEVPTWASGMPIAAEGWKGPRLRK